MEKSSYKMPIFDGSNYAYWKARMRSALKAIDERVWILVERGWTPPTVTVDNVTNLKPDITWTDEEFKWSSFNSKGLSAISGSVTPDEFKRIMTCTTSKEAWDVLQLTHEGTNAVKESKLQNLTTQFETITMHENECFDEFYARLSDIVNTSYNLGEHIPNARVVKKILRSLPKRFIPKVTVLNSLGNLNTLKLEELVGDLQTYEIDMFPKSAKPKDKGIALKAQERKSEGSARKKVESSRKIENSDSECEFDLDDLALFAKNFKKILKFKKGGNFKDKKNF